MNRFGEAEESLSAGLAVLEEQQGGDAVELEVLSARNNVAHLYNQRSKHEEARDLARATVAACERMGSFEGARTVLCAALNNLGNALRSLGNAVEARPVYEQSCTLREALYGEDHPSVLLAMNNLANLIYMEGDDVAAALALHQRVLERRLEIFGDEHFYPSTSRKNIGLCLQALGRLDEAEASFRGAHEARLALFGPKHNKTAETFALLGDLCVARGRPERALPHFREALAAWSHTHGDPKNAAVKRAAEYVRRLEGGEALPEGEPLARFT